MDDSKKEWDNAEEVDLPREDWEQVWQSVLRKKKWMSATAWAKKTALAASVVGLFFVAAKFLTPASEPEQLAQSPRLPVAEQKLLVNTTDSVITVTLPDSSVAQLWPAAILTYQVPFTDNKRNFTLEGRGRFSVRSNPSMPFTVYAGNLATTALGTEFTVNNSASKNITVQLHKGKVMVKQSTNLANTPAAPVYLDPGQQLTYNIAAMTSTVSLIREKKITGPAVAIKPQKPEPAPASGELSFTNSPLSDVIQKLTQHFGQSIRFDSTDIAESNFTGSFAADDSVSVILRIIAQMNNLEVIEAGSGFLLQRK